MKNDLWHRPCGRGSRQRGMTLIELMVALAVGLVVVIAAVASLVVGRIGFTSVDSSTQLRENGRYAASIIQRVVDESGFQDVAGGQFPDPATAPPPSLLGYDNSLVPPSSYPVNFPLSGLASGTRTSGCSVTDTSCVNGSDVLVVRYWGVSQPPGDPTKPDGSIVNCAGGKEPERATGPSFSIFSVGRSQSGEPTLICTYQDLSGAWTTVPLVTGVEGFQILYGTFGVTANVCSSAPIDSTTGEPKEQPTDSYLTAAQMQGSGGAYCANNWARVRTLRIGMLLRGPASSAVVKGSAPTSISVLGGPNASYSFSTAADVGSTLTVPADGRLRQQMVFTVALRNMQQTR